MVSVFLLESAKLLPQQMSRVRVQAEDGDLKGTVLVEYGSALEVRGVSLEEGLLNQEEGDDMLLITNRTGFTLSLEPGQELGTASRVDIVSTDVGWRASDCQSRRQDRLNSVCNI